MFFNRRTELDLLIDTIRKQRERVCFTVINRGKLWYDLLTIEQLDELRSWYHAWLDAPVTLEVPVTPNWVNKTLPYEEEILL